MTKTPAKLVKVHVLVSFGTLANMGFACDSIAEVDEVLAGQMVAIGHAEYVAPPRVEPKTETAEAPAPEVAMHPKRTRKADA